MKRLHIDSSLLGAGSASRARSAARGAALPKAHERSAAITA
jgi:hypothetical protein